MGFNWKSPRVRNAFNLEVVNAFQAGMMQARISGILDLVGVKTTTSQNIAALVYGRNFSLYRRPWNSNWVHKRGVSIDEQRGSLDNFVEFFTMPLGDCVYDKIDKVMATAANAGLIAAEGPSRMMEAAIPIALETLGYDGVPFWSASHPVSGVAGDIPTFSNLKDYGDLDFATFDQAIQDLSEIPDQDGYAAGAKATILAYSPKYKVAAMNILMSQRPLEYAGENFRTQYGIRGIEIPSWAGDNMWMVADISFDADRPFWFVEGRPLRVKPLYTNPEGEYENLHNELIWMVTGDMAALLGNHRRAILSAPAGSLATILAKHKARFEMNKQGPNAFDLEAA